MKKTKSYTIDESLIRPLKNLAIREKRSQSQIVERAIAKELKVKL